jgi:hypothetical protein
MRGAIPIPIALELVYGIVGRELGPWLDCPRARSCNGPPLRDAAACMYTRRVFKPPGVYVYNPCEAPRGWDGMR